jgi:hypothetical protein
MVALIVSNLKKFEVPFIFYILIFFVACDSNFDFQFILVYVFGIVSFYANFTVGFKSKDYQFFIVTIWRFLTIFFMVLSHGQHGYLVPKNIKPKHSLQKEKPESG